MPSFPHAILHIDGDAFFASCEQARNPALAGKPVITGKERGIAASMSYEAKARGVTRAMPLWEIRKLIPDAIILPSDYETYSMLAERFYRIVRRWAGDNVEEYGIDECFADITGSERSLGQSYCQVAEDLRATLKRELGSTFSVGLAPNKVLAKVASKWQKPYGLTAIPLERVGDFLRNLPTGNIWGIGSRTAQFLAERKITTALQFACQNEWWVKQNLSRPFHDIWRELNGEMVMPLVLEEKTSYASIQKFRTFTPPSNDSAFVFSQLSKNIENGCIKLRRHGLSAPSAAVILRTQDFRHAAREITLVRPTNLPPEILPDIADVFKKMFSPRILYRATGIVFFNLAPAVLQPDLFGASRKIQKFQRLYAGADKVSAKYGKHTLFLGTSFQAQKFGAHLTDRGDDPERKEMLFIGETKRKRIGLPMWLGKVV